MNPAMAFYNPPSLLPNPKKDLVHGTPIPKAIGVLATILVLFGSGAAQGSKVARGTSFVGTLEDGTAKVITLDTNADESPNNMPDVMLEHLDLEPTSSPTTKQAKTSLAKDNSTRIETITVTKTTNVKTVDSEQQLDQTSTKAEESKSEDPKIKRAAYKIPVDKKSEVIARLKLTAKIAQKYGLAFDYRQMTSKDLSRIWNALEAKKN
jgi:hypothetical protein